MQPTILLVDDDHDTVRLLEYHLLGEGFNVLSTATGQDALRIAEEYHPDLIILDLVLLGIDGKEVCKILKTQPETEHIPILILSARASETDRIIGFELGCDDYVPKPFNTRELILRVKALLRRMNPPSDTSEVLRVGELTIDTTRHAAFLDGHPINFTPNEFKLLVHLVRRRNRVQTRNIILSQVWGHSIPSMDTRTIDTHIRRLRVKLGPMGNLIRTVPKVGYIFETDQEPLLEGTHRLRSETGYGPQQLPERPPREEERQKQG